MARKLTTNQEIDAFIAKVIEEAHDHGQNIEHVIHPLSDEVRQRLDLNLDKVEVYERNGNLARTCWVTLQGSRYAFTYNYQTKQIDLRNRSTQGALRFSFENATTLADIQTEVGKL